MIWTGAGTLPGIGLIALGLDQIATGSMNIRYGRINQGFSVVEFLVYRGTGNETAAILAPGVLSLGFGSAGSFGRLGVRAGAGAAEGAGGFGVFNPFNMARVAGAPESAIVRNLYLAQAGSWSFGAKLFAHNVLSLPMLLVGGRWRWWTRPAVVEQLLMNSTFESVSLLARARIDRIAGRYFFQHPESLGWLSRGTAQHELLHLGQFLRSPRLWENSPWRLVHEYIPSLLGPVFPNSAAVVVGSTMAGYFGTRVYWMVDELWEALIPRILGFDNQQRR